MVGSSVRSQFVVLFLLLCGIGLAADSPHAVFNQKVSLGTKGPVVDVTVDAQGNLKIVSAGVLRLSLAADSWVAFDDGDTPVFDPSVIEFVDITFDGLADLKVLVARGAYNFIYQYWAWTPSVQKFLPISGLEEISNPEFDPKALSLVSWNKGRGYGDLWVRREYQWTGKSWKTGVEQERQMVDENVEGSGYVLIQREYRQGRWVEVSREADDDPSSDDF